MTINTDFTDWPNTGLDWNKAPYESCSPNLQLLQAELEARWPGFFSLGCHYDRTIRNGARISTHAFGAAQDAGYKPDEGVTRHVLITEVLPWLIANSAELGIQAIHDQGRIWRSYRSGDANGGWKIYNTGYGNWIHIEVTFGQHGNDKPIDERLAKVPPAATPIVPDENSFLRFDPVEGEFGLWPIRQDLPIIKRVTGDVEKFHRDTCSFVQGVILHHAGGNIVVDGQFGRQTDGRVKDLQKWFELEVDGIVGPITMGVVQYVAAIHSATHSQQEAA